jgi:hypothetical protein
LRFCWAILAILTTSSSGKKYVTQQKILHNFLKSNNCRKIFDKFTKILLKNCTNFGKLVKSGISENFSLPPPPPPPPPSPQQFWEKKY